MDVCRGRSGPPVAAWPGRHRDPWSLCSCSRPFGRQTLPEEKIPSSENLRANAEWRSKGRCRRYTHFVVLSRESKNCPAKISQVFCFSSPYITRFFQISKKHFTLPNIAPITSALIFTLEGGVKEEWEMQVPKTLLNNGMQRQLKTLKSDLTSL